MYAQFPGGGAAYEGEAGGRSLCPAQLHLPGFPDLPEDPQNHDPDKFYGFVFQDTDFSKWIEAVAYSLTWRPDPALEHTADEAIDLVCEAHDECGYLDGYSLETG